MKLTLPPAQSKSEACSAAGSPGPAPPESPQQSSCGSGFCFGVPSLFFHLCFLLADLSSVTPAVLHGHHSHDLPLTFSPSPQAAFAKGAHPEAQPMAHFVRSQAVSKRPIFLPAQAVLTADRLLTSADQPQTEDSGSQE